MGRDWIIDVLADLRCFARDNDLPLLSAQLEHAELVAQIEIASAGVLDRRHRHSDTTGSCGGAAKDSPTRRP